MDQYFLNYASLQQQRWMLSDVSRNSAFAKALAEVVKPGDLVVDVGAGTGFLSLLAAKSGARQVVGVERSDMAKFARKIVKDNELEGRVEIVQDDAKNLELNEKADVIVSEWLGHMAFVEGMFRSVIEVRDKWLKPGGKLIPSAVEVMLAPIDWEELYEDYGPGFWNKERIHGIDYSRFTESELQMGHANTLHIQERVLIAEGQSLMQFDTATAKHGDEWCSGVVRFTIEKDGILNGFAGWFNSQLSPNSLLDTSPSCPETHWSQTYFPHYPRKVKKGDVVEVNYTMDEAPGHPRLMELILDVEGKKICYLVE